MRNRIQLQRLLEKILGTRNVYFQPPESLKLKYPCIVYSKSNEDVRFADDTKYLKKDVYDITIIDRNPDSEIPDAISELKYCSFDRYFVSDNLNHYSYRLYF